MNTWGYTPIHSPHTSTWYCVSPSEARGKKKKKIKLSCNRLWRPVLLWDVQALTFSRQLAHRWRWGCQPYFPAALDAQEHSWYSLLLEAESTPGPQCGWKGYFNWKSNYLIGKGTRDLPACSILPQPSALPRVPSWSVRLIKRMGHRNSVHTLTVSPSLPFLTSSSIFSSIYRYTSFLRLEPVSSNFFAYDD
jgi:hypothetical protein